MENQRLKIINHNIRNMIPMNEKDMEFIRNVDKDKLLVLIRSLNEALGYLTETFFDDDKK